MIVLMLLLIGQPCAFESQIPQWKVGSATSHTIAVYVLK